MYRAFELTIDEDIHEELWFKNYVEIGKGISNPTEKAIGDILQELLWEGTIDGTALSEKYFPTLKRDIFLSYSHNDKDLAYMVSGMMSELFNLNTFIDSYFWGSADELLLEIDNQYCWQGGSETYSYRKRNFSTSHVHAMLTASIMKAMDSAEIVIFLNTQNSVPDLEEAINKDGYDEYTLSPWIYEEMLLTTMLKETSWEVYRRDWGLVEEVATARLEKSLKIKYKLPKDNLIPLNLDDIVKWHQKYQERKDICAVWEENPFLFALKEENHPLNILYEMKCGVEKTN